MSDCLNISQVVPVPKKGDPLEVDNYRGISLVLTVTKVPTTVLQKRINDFAEECVSSDTSRLQIEGEVRRSVRCAT